MKIVISIHKALTGLDEIQGAKEEIERIFQSTRPSRASTGLPPYIQFFLRISIHKALTGLDPILHA